MQKKHLFLKKNSTAGIGVILGASVSLAALCPSAQGAGFEKSVLWSGKWVGVGAAASSAVRGAESLYFNPAGLASGRKGFEVSGNFSPTLGEFQGPVTGPNTQSSTGYEFSPVFGLLGSYGITPQWGVGIGAFVSSGIRADYNNVSFPGYSYTPNVKADIYAIDYSIGTGYEILPGLRIGAAWRISHVQAGFASTLLTTSPISSLTGTEFNNLGVTRFNGYRVGIQYTSSDAKWGLGANYRSALDFTAHGNGTQKTYSKTGILVDTTINSAAIASSLPQQVSVGANYAIMKTVRLYAEWTWTEYDVDQVLHVMTSNGTARDITLGWSNQQNYRIGVACSAVPNWVFRAGYVLTTQVTPPAYALPQIEAPGTGNTITLGAGTHLLAKAMDVDVALEHGWVSGNSTAADQAIYGHYYDSDWDAHLGVTYRFM